jgi:hypothetical protein
MKRGINLRQGTFGAAAGSVLQLVADKTEGRPMQGSFAARMWLGVVLYAAIGLFGVVVLTRGEPSTAALTEGYGTAYGTAAHAIVRR